MTARQPRSLAEDLRGWNDEQLARLLHARPDLVRPAPKDITTLAARATTGPSTARCLDGLDALTLYLLTEVARTSAESATSTRAVLASTLAQLAPLEPDDLERERDLASTLASALAFVRALALVWGPDDALRCTHAVRDALLGSTAAERGRTIAAWPPADLQPGPVLSMDLVDAEAGWQAVRRVAEVRDLLGEWGLQPPAVLRTGGLSVRDLAAAMHIVHADAHGTALVVEVAHAAGLLGDDQQAPPSWVPTERFDEWLDLPGGTAWDWLARAWLTLPRLPWLADERSNLLHPAQARPSVIRLRRSVLEVLAEVSPGSPVHPARLAAVVAYRWPRRAGALLDQVLPATLAEATALGLVAMGSLTTAGRALLTSDSIHGSAAEAMGAAMPPEVSEVLVQADLTIVAPGPLTWEVQRHMRLLADVESTGHATVYRVSPASLARAIASGLDGPALRDLLTRASRTPLPAALTTLIDDVARRHGSVRVGLAQAYLRCADPALAATIATDRRLARLGLVRVGDDVLVADAPASMVLEALRAAGYAPAAERPDGTVLMAPRVQRRLPAEAAGVHAEAGGANGPAAVDVRLVKATVRALRATHAPQRSDQDGLRPDLVRRSTGSGVLTMIRSALADAQPVWVAYAEADGTTSEQAIDPIRVSGGTVTAFDHRIEQVRTFTLARIAWTAPIAGEH